MARSDQKISFTQFGENKYIPKQWDNLCELCLSAPLREI